LSEHLERVFPHGREFSMRPNAAVVGAISVAAVSWAPFADANTLDLLTAGLLSLVLATTLTSRGRRRGDAA
jgi:hypothetical protein